MRKIFRHRFHFLINLSEICGIAPRNEIIRWEPRNLEGILHNLQSAASFSFPRCRLWQGEKQPRTFLGKLAQIPVNFPCPGLVFDLSGNFVVGRPNVNLQWFLVRCPNDLGWKTALLLPRFWRSSTYKSLFLWAKLPNDSLFREPWQILFLILSI